MHIKKLKVRPRKNPPVSLCATELSGMLSCWAATKDYSSTTGCSEHAKALFECMRTAPMKQKQHRPTINYHLARLGKQMK